MNNTIDIKLPKDNVNDEFVRILSCPFNDGDEVKQNDILIEYETSKADVEYASENIGYIKYLCKSGDEIKPGETIIRLFQNIDDLKQSSMKVEKPTTINTSSKTRFSKKAEKLINEKKIPYTQFQNFSFVTSKDISSNLIDNNGFKDNDKSDQEKLNTENKDIFTEEISNTKKREIDNLRGVQSSNLTSVVAKSIHIENLNNWINTNSTALPQSVLPLIVFESSRLLKKYKYLNSYFSEDKIHFYQYVNIGFAIDLEKGLKSLTIYNADKKTYPRVETEIINLSEKYLEDELTKEDLTNSTFTISDLTSEHSTFFIPLINKNQSAILGIGKTENQINLILSFDHRVVTGKYSQKFLNDLAERIEVYIKSDLKEIIICSKCLISLREESKLSGKGLIRIINSDGKIDFICINCLLGN